MGRRPQLSGDALLQSLKLKSTAWLEKSLAIARARTGDAERVAAISSVLQSRSPLTAKPIARLSADETGRRTTAIQAATSLEAAAQSLGMSAVNLKKWMRRRGLAEPWPKRSRNAANAAAIERTRESWKAAKKRCRNPNNASYKWYGAVGVTFHPAWDDFERFVADVGLRPENTSLDRIDSSKSYEPGNCRWADIRTQQRNRRVHRRFVFDGQTLLLSEIAERTGVCVETLYSRILGRGMSVDEAAQAPTRSQPHHKNRAA